MLEKEKRRRRYLGRIYALLHGEHFIKTHMRENANAKKKTCLRKCFTLQARPVALGLGRGRGRMQTFFLPPSVKQWPFLHYVLHPRPALGGGGEGSLLQQRRRKEIKQNCFDRGKKAGKYFFFLAFFSWMCKYKVIETLGKFFFPRETSLLPRPNSR